MRYNEFRMTKRAFGEGIGTFIVQAPLTAAAVLLGAAGLTGAAAGAVGAKIFSHSDLDNANIKDSYMNERTRADIRYLGSRLNEEHARRKHMQGAKAARVLG